MTISQLDTIQLLWGKEDHRIHQVCEHLKKKDISKIPEGGIIDAYNKIYEGGLGDGDDDLIDQIYNKLYGAWKS